MVKIKKIRFILIFKIFKIIGYKNLLILKYIKKSHSSQITYY